MLGEYSRWDDLFRKEHLFLFFYGEYESKFFNQNNHVALVFPVAGFEKKKQFFDEMKDLLEQHDVVVEVIDRKQIADYVDKVEQILFVDEDELRGTMCLYRWFANSSFELSKCKTYCRFADSIVDVIANTTLLDLKNRGVKVLSYNLEEGNGEWLKWLYKEINEKFRRAGVKKQNVLLPQWKKAFLEETINKEYEEQIMPFPLSVYMQNGIRVLGDCENSLFHLERGHRVTIGQPKEYKNCIHMYGPCIICGPLVEDRHTIASFLQEKVNQEGLSYKVINHGMPGSDMQAIDKILSTTFREGDIVILDRVLLKMSDIEDINMLEVLSKNNVSAQWFTDCVRHCNYKVNKLIAEELFHKVCGVEQKVGVKNDLSIDIENDFVMRHYIKRYFEKKDALSKSKVGAIVMNCNPFTDGHRYLIEEACKKVDRLIIFVVEENQSVFSFNERYAMVCEGTLDLEKVIVVPSGEYILSSATFPEYFVKQEDEDMIANIEEDVMLFAKRIAPALNITYRFVGEELEDGVTNEYNKAMKRILLNYGIEVIEIPRKKTGECVISASSVRRCLEAGDMEQVSKLVPQSTVTLLGKLNI